MAEVIERPLFVDWAAHSLKRDPADVIAWADTDDAVVLVFRQGDKRRVAHAQVDSAAPVAAETAAPDEADPTPESEPSVAAETPAPIDSEPAAELEQPTIAIPVDEPEPAAKPKTTRRGGR